MFQKSHASTTEMYFEKPEQIELTEKVMKSDKFTM